MVPIMILICVSYALCLLSYAYYLVHAYILDRDAGQRQFTVESFSMLGALGRRVCG